MRLTEPVVLKATPSAGERLQVFSRAALRDLWIPEAHITFDDGCQFDVSVRLWAADTNGAETIDGNTTRVYSGQPLIGGGLGNDYVVGNNETLQVAINRPCRQGLYLCFDIDNADAYEHKLQVRFAVAELEPGEVIQ